ncbi:hypothetical protein WJX72_002725 [[Myrmecia] bisecta]|uniref:Capsid protein n=1 Tax=[Myrmecia] bisecta TaxID=41462 RepID=A0AAW1PSG3_9CHLO
MAGVVQVSIPSLGQPLSYNSTTKQNNSVLLVTAVPPGGVFSQHYPVSEGTIGVQLMNPSAFLGNQIRVRLLQQNGDLVSDANVNYILSLVCYEVIVPVGLIAADKGETIRLTLLDLVMKNNMTAVQTYNAGFIVQTGGVQTRFDVPLGFYSVFTLAAWWASALPGWTLAYCKQTSRYHFTAPTASTLIFDDPSLENSACSFFGFSQADRPAGTSFWRSTAVDVTGEEALYLHADLPYAKGANVDCLDGHFATGASNAARGANAATGGLLSGFIRDMPHGAQALDTLKTTAKAGVKIGKLADSLRGAKATHL